MTTKLALILTGAWTLLMVVACSGAFWIVAAKVPRHQQEERARLFGSGMGVVALVGYAAVWLPWAVAYRKRRQQIEDEDEADVRDTPKRRRKRP